jgi:murein endopeptidase
MLRRLLPILAPLGAILVAAGAVWAAAGGSASVPPSQPTIAPPTTTPPTTAPPLMGPVYPPIRWGRCRSVGKPWAGRLVKGSRLPAEGRDFFTWDPVRKRKPNRWWRRYACDFTVRRTLRVLRSYREAFPDAPRVGIGDLSRPRGGAFGKRFGGLGHGSHQSGVDVDVYYPRVDGLERAPRRVRQIDRELAQELVSRFARAGARYAFVGPHTGLTGPRRVVRSLVHHDDHVHVRFRVPRSRRQ